MPSRKSGPDSGRALSHSYVIVPRPCWQRCSSNVPSSRLDCLPSVPEVTVTILAARHLCANQWVTYIAGALFGSVWLQAMCFQSSRELLVSWVSRRPRWERCRVLPGARVSHVFRVGLWATCKSCGKEGGAYLAGAPFGSFGHRPFAGASESQPVSRGSCRPREGALPCLARTSVPNALFGSFRPRAMRRKPGKGEGTRFANAPFGVSGRRPLPSGVCPASLPDKLRLTRVSVVDLSQCLPAMPPKKQVATVAAAKKEARIPVLEAPERVASRRSVKF